jgi:phage FluMu gp28-like protein
VTASLTYHRPHLYEKQRAFVDSAARYVVVEASTKTGKTVGMLVWLTEQALAGTPGQVFWWVAPVYGQAKIAFGRLKRFLPRHVYTANESEMTITLANGAVIWFKSGEKPDNLYGEDVVAAVIDEATRLREESWWAIRSTLTATRGRLRIIGNVKGQKNWAFRLAREAQGGGPHMAYFKLTAYDAVEGGVLDEAEVADAKAVLPPKVFDELYLAIPSDDGGNPFGLEAIRACLAPLSTATPAVWGWDLAKSVDWTVGIALDQGGAACRFERWQAPWRATTADIRAMTRTTPALVDSTGVGDPVLEELQAGTDNFEGYKFTPSSKQQLMEGLAMAIQQRAVTFPEGVISNELSLFEYEYTRTGVRYRAPEGEHDDAVCALALAVQKSRASGRDQVLVFSLEDEVSDDDWFSLSA